MSNSIAHKCRVVVRRIMHDPHLIGAAECDCLGSTKPNDGMAVSIA